MKLKSASIYLVESGGIRPVILELETDSGLTGLGEACIAYGVGGTGTAGMLKDIVERYMNSGLDLLRIEALWTEIYDHGFWAKGGGPIVYAAMSAIEQALFDIKARSLNVPVYELLGGRIHDWLRTYCNGWYFGCTRDEDLPRAAAKAVEDGYDALKFYPFATILPDGRLRHPSYRAASDRSVVQRSIRTVRDLRNAVGPDVELMLDLSAGLTPDDTIRFCQAVEPFDITYVEEPAVPGDVGALVKIARSISQRIAVGERIYSRYGFRDVLESRAADILQPDIGNTGGLLEARKIAAMAEAYSMKVQPHICASALSTAVGMHFSASIPNFYIQEHFPYWGRIPGHVDVLEDPIESSVREGFIPVKDAPGFGVHLRRAALEKSVFASFSWQ
ncbi:mandelate racemase/muconate lactonizing enzyme family protein [Microvirga makkahensis]|uniref:Mandelate racemase/muconate lactonizing enzyme family protein n=1 Tax=Microvirga makkahensis TaxID=1128670 RepID=A0A7X3MNY5_9HYPH|nr:mandelate racemase/muconate lactonizing enzyme family protein [Microvirga makkahensis]MXQ10546.1 mandelate racemase/muconate lactonizing enzyme family protein [Microvirga makkahensis]